MLIIALILTGLLLTACYTDARTFLIPNWISLALLAVWPSVLFSPVPVDWATHLMVLGISFVVGFALFTLRVMGGGDIKLITALSLWLGTAALMPFLMLMGILGGILALVALMGRKLAPWVALKLNKSAESIPRIFSQGQPIPYGLAIAIGFLILLWQGRVPGVVVAF